MAVRIVITSTGAAVTGTTSTAAVMRTGSLDADLARRFPGWVRATLSGSTLSFYAPDRVVEVSPPTIPRTYTTIPGALLGNMTLTIDTLGRAVAGNGVIVDAGGGDWRAGLVVSDGSTVATGGQMIDASTVACAVSNENGQVSPAPGASPVVLLGGSSDGGANWFAVGAAQTQYMAGATSTIGAVSPPATVFAKVNGSWQILLLT